jgi:hypothetical protein
MFEPDRIAGAKHDRSLHHVPELANVARPIVGTKTSENLRRKTRRGP